MRNPLDAPELPANGSEPPSADPSERPSPRYSALLRARWRILRRTLAGAALFGVISFLIPPKYESAARLMPPDQKSTAGVVLAALNQIPGSSISDLGLTRTTGALFVSIMASRTVEDALIQRLDLRRVYRVGTWQAARAKLEANTDMSEDRKSGVITVRVRDRDRERAETMCRMYVEELNRLSTQLSTSAASREREFLERRLNVVKQELDQSAGNLGTFSSNNTTIDISQQSKAMVDATASLQGQLIAAESELRGIKEIYGDSNVRVLALQGRVAELRRKLHMLTGQDPGAGSNPDVPYPSIRKLPLLGVTYSDLLRRTTLNEAVYEALTKQYELAKIQEVKDTPTVRLLDPPNFPEKRAFPPRLLITAFGAFLGLLLALMQVLLAALYPQHSGRLMVHEALQAGRADFEQLKAHAKQVLRHP